MNIVISLDSWQQMSENKFNWSLDQINKVFLYLKVKPLFDLFTFGRLEVPFLKIIKTFHGSLRSYTVKKNYIYLEVSEILIYRQTDIRKH